MDAVLVPHGSPAGVAPAIQVLYDDGRNVALRVTIGAEVWTLVDNPDGITISNASVTTDART